MLAVLTAANGMLILLNPTRVQLRIVEPLLQLNEVGGMVMSEGKTKETTAVDYKIGWGCVNMKV